MGRIREGNGSRSRELLLAAILLLAATGAAAAPAAVDGHAPAASDSSAVAVAQRVLERMGGRAAWDATRYVKWTFLGRRTHTWDRFTGNLRTEFDDGVALVNVRTREGRVFEQGREVTAPSARQDALDQAYAWWVNDSYWLLMPWKLLDPGVHLRDAGASALADGRPARRLVVTFDEDAGLTPRNKYDVWVADDTGLVEQWAYYPDRDDSEPKFVLPWAGWKEFGDPPILIATDHGRGADWAVAVPASVPPATFEQP